MIVVLLVCLLVSFLVGLAGVGGILVPPVLILMSGLEPHTAMGTALASFIGTGFVGTWLYHKNGHYRFMEAVPFALGSFVCVAPGALVNARIDAGPLVMILAVIIVFAGACTLRPPKPGRKGSPFWLGWKGRAVIGGATGFMAGLTGAGGPVASIPWMVLVGYSPIHAVALSMPYQIATSFSGSVGNMMGGMWTGCCCPPCAPCRWWACWAASPWPSVCRHRFCARSSVPCASDWGPSSSCARRAVFDRKNSRPVSGG